ncbi:stalk domain-containing protein [Paenibacillus tyrfis]|uniref:stalk domain-containing protein n=1 Tax=Paenibacillus tyrfis TaxID=1501230 RepID=UPI0020A0E174|nr:stalk domain-containing protein [Paenibacillus tyrfis]MCP1309100.1 stalk domain-containing protein [Paenibacillus tyrfis]
MTIANRKPYCLGGHDTHRRSVRRLLAAVVSAGLLLGHGLPVQADAIWDRWKAADAAVAKGDAASAVPHWKFLVEHYAAAGDWENAALFSGKLNQHFDGIKDYEQAIRYYEQENEYWLKAGKDWGAVDLQRAEQIRTTIEAYIGTQDAETLRRQAAPKNGKLAKFEPEYGTYIGMYTERDPGMQNYFDRSESLYGKKHALYLAYAQVGKPFPKQHAARAKQAGAALQIGWEPMNGLDAVTDDVVRQWAKDAKAAGIPIFLRYASEMNGDWVVWHGDPQKYIDKFKMVHDIMAEEAPNVAMVWSPGDVPMYSMDAYYPGDDYVDWVGVSMYTEPYENGDPQQGNMQATSPVERLDHLYKTYADRKPLMISETAVSHYANLPQESFTDYGLLNLQRLYEVMPFKYPRLKSITYFNVNLDMKESKNNYLLRDNEAMLNLYKQLISSPYYLSRVEQGAKPSDHAGFVSMGKDNAIARAAKLIPFVKIPDIYIGKLEYYLNGTLLATQTAPPFGIDLVAGAIPEGSVFELAVYNREGQKSGSRSFPIASRISVDVDGKAVPFEQPPVLIEGNTLTPLRAIFEAMGAKVEWDEATRTATGKKGSTTVSVTIGSGAASINREAYHLEAPARLVNGYTMVPARFIGEAFGGKVEWDGETQTVRIGTGSGTESGTALRELPVSLTAVKSSSTVTALSAERKSPSDTKPGPLQAVGAWFGWVGQQLSKLWNDLI